MPEGPDKVVSAGKRGFTCAHVHLRGQDQCGIDNINISFLAPSSLLALVDRPPSRLAGIVKVSH